MSRLVNLLTFKKYAGADLYITITGIFRLELTGIAKNARIVDLQHGVIFSKHSGYFDQQGDLLKALRACKSREYWVYGEGFRDAMLSKEENRAFLMPRIHIIGDVLAAGQHREIGHQVDMTNDPARDAIVFSLQYTPTLSEAQMRSLTDTMAQLLAQIEAAGLNRKYKILLKHHPRYGNCYDLTELNTRFKWIQYTDKSTNELLRHAIYHVTAYSTTALEYAMVGIPSLIFFDALNPEGKQIFLEEFHYPFSGNFDAMLQALNDRTEMANQSQKVRDWYHRFYAPYSTTSCQSLLMGKW